MAALTLEHPFKQRTSDMNTDDDISTSNRPISGEPASETAGPQIRFSATGTLALTGSSLALAGSVEVGIPRPILVLGALVVAALLAYLLLRAAAPVTARAVAGATAFIPLSLPLP
jgi:hypothetical protein